MKKSILIILIAIILCAAIAAVIILIPKESEPTLQTTKTTQATTTAEPQKSLYSEGLEYVLNSDGTFYTVIGIGTCTDEDIRIPPTYEDLPVAKIGYMAFFECETIKSVTIPGSVTDIDSHNFCYCPNLESVIISEGLLTRLSERELLRHCPKLQSITLPKSLTDIAWLFASDSSGTGKPCDIYYNGSIEDFCKITLYQQTFTGNLYCEGELVEEITLSPEAAENGKYAFAGCQSLKSVTIAEGAQSLAEGIFQNCASLESVTLPSTLKTIGVAAFQFCYALKSLTLPSALTSIKSYALSCTSIENIELPSSLETLGTLAFDGSRLKSITISEGITEIPIACFQNCRKLEKVTLPSTLETIEKNAFNQCFALKSITIPKSVTSIEDLAFQLSNLEDIYYTGTTEEWDRIKEDRGWYSAKDSYSVNIHRVTLHTTDGNYKMNYGSGYLYRGSIIE